MGKLDIGSQQTEKAALESALLSFGAGFESLNKENALIDVRHLNTHAIAFCRRFGAIETGRDAENPCFTLSRVAYQNIKSILFRTIEAAQ